MPATRPASAIEWAASEGSRGSNETMWSRSRTDVRFTDRADAGQRLAEHLASLTDRPNVVAVGLPRGGVPVAAEVAAALGCPLDVIVVRKLGVPGQRELAMGAIGEGGVRVLNRDVVAGRHLSADEIVAVEEAERAELDRRSTTLRAEHPRIDLDGKVVVVIDDGLATGATARAACDVARAAGAAEVVLAVPVAPSDWLHRMAGVADRFVAVATPADFMAVGRFYDDFAAVSDHEVQACLAKARNDG